MDCIRWWVRVNPHRLCQTLKSLTAMTTDELLAKFNLTWTEVKEYCRLKAVIFGSGGPFKQLFVELDPEKNPDHKRYNELSGKMVHLHAHLINHRNEG